MRWLAAVGLLLVLGACSQREAKEAVAAQTRDPEAAMFRNVRTTSNGVCGEVNAKNGYGGYVGFRRFAYDTRTKQATIESETTGDETIDRLRKVNFDMASNNAGC